MWSRFGGTSLFYDNMNKALFVLPLVLLSLLAAIWAGWIRIGIQLPAPGVAAHHGSLMINGFLGSLIFLERAVTFKNKLVLLLPLANAVSIAAYLTGAPQLAAYLHIGGSLGFMVMCAYFIYRYKETYYYLFFAGAFCLLAGNLVLYSTQLYPAAIVWWMEFLLFTIVAERLELSRFLPYNKWRQSLLFASLSLVLAGAFIPFHAGGNTVFALALCLTAAWLLKYDMAFKSIRNKGQHRYSGLLLITGYCWMLATAAIILFEKSFVFGYDALLHAFFIGFVFSMIFSHAPIILPAVAKLPIKIYRPVLYIWFVVLQVSLAARVISDFTGEMNMRKFSGMINGLSILAFFITILFIVSIELRKRRRRSLKS